MATDYTSQIVALYTAIDYYSTTNPPPAAQVAVFNAALQSGTLTLAAVQSDIINSPYTQTTVNPVIREYQAAFGRVPDQAGVAYWVGQVAANPNQLNTLSTTFASSAEFQTRYGATATTQANPALVAALYTNVLGRQPDAAGLAYWSSQNLNAGQLLTAFAQSGEFITNTSSAITAYQNLEASGTPPTSGSLFSVPGATIPGATIPLTTGIDTINSTVVTDTVIGLATGNLSTSTLNAGDTINMAGGTLKVVQTGGVADNLAGVTINGPFKLVAQEVGTNGTYNLAQSPTVTAVTSLNSTGTATFQNVATGAIVTSSGAATTGGINYSEATTTAPVEVAFNGVKGILIQESSTGGPTSATIDSTGAANGTATAIDTATFNGNGTVSSLKIAAATNLFLGLQASDFVSTGAALAVTGTASVDLVHGASGNFSSIDASSLSTGGLTVNSDAALKSFLGGGGNDFLLGTAISSSVTSLNGGAGTNSISASLITGQDAGLISNFQLIDVTNQSVTVDAALLTNDTISGVTISSNETGGHTNSVLHLQSAVTVTDAATLADTLTLSHVSGVTNGSVAVSFTADGSSLNLTSTGDSSVTVASNPAGTGTDALTLAETDNHLATVTLTGADGLSFNVTTATVGAPANTVSALTTIDGSAATGNLTISAGTTAGNVSYNGLVIKGGTGQDSITNGADNGSVILQSHANDAGTAGGHNQTFTFGAGATATLNVFNGSAVTAGNLGAGNPETTTVNGAAAGFSINFSTITSGTIHDETNGANVQSAHSVITAATAAVTDAGLATAAGQVVYFTFAGNEYFVGDSDGSGTFNAGDTLVKLVGGNFHGATDATGIVHLA